MTTFIQLAFQGIALGAVYALLALAFCVIYRASRVVNFAQGAMLLLGVYVVSWAAVDHEIPFAAAVLLGMVVVALLGVALERGLLRRVAGSDEFIPIMATLGVGIAISATVQILFGSDPRLLGDPWGSSATSVGEITLNWVRIFSIVTALVALVAYFAFDRYTRYGLGIRATALDEEAAASVGIPIRRVHAITWGIAGALAVLAGIFLAGFPSSPNLTLGDAALRAFPAVVLGGLGSPAGAVIGGLAIGATEVLVAGYAPDWAGSNVNAVVPYIVMIAVLLVRPHGLFGSAEVSRA